MRSLALFLVLASPLAAQQDNRGTDFWVNRMKERLGLTEEQASKVREILAKDAEERTKMDDARTAKVNELLNDEQKKKYEEMRSQGRGFGGANRAGGQGGFGGFGGGRGPGQLQMDDLKRELGLSDEQVEKIKPMIDEFGQQIQKRMEEMRTNGFQGLNLAEEMQKGQEAMKQLADKVKVHLTDEQKTKLDGLMERMTGWMRMVPQLLGQRQGATATAAVRPSVEERVRRAMEALKIEKDEERAAVRELVEKVVRAQHELEDAGKSARERLGAAAKNAELSDAAVEDQIKASIEERRKLEKALGELQKQLVDVVSSRQELELMSQGILK
jgi:hypothetical protein